MLDDAAGRQPNGSFQQAVGDRGAILQEHGLLPGGWAHGVTPQKKHVSKSGAGETYVHVGMGCFAEAKMAGGAGQECQATDVVACSRGQVVIGRIGNAGCGEAGKQSALTTVSGPGDAPSLPSTPPCFPERQLGTMTPHFSPQRELKTRDRSHAGAHHSIAHPCSEGRHGELSRAQSGLSSRWHHHHPSQNPPPLSPLPCSARCQRKGRAEDRRDNLGAARPPGAATASPTPLLGAALLHPNLMAQGQRGAPSTSTLGGVTWMGGAPESSPM